MTATQTIPTPDLTQRPPRSPRVRLGGYAMLARVLDKARASLTGKAGDYKYGNPMDQDFFVRGFGAHGDEAESRGMRPADKPGDVTFL